MSEDKNVSKPRQLWDSAVKAVKGGSTEQLVETFTSEMTLVAEGLCEDQNNLRKCWTPPCGKTRRTLTDDWTS